MEAAEPLLIGLLGLLIVSAIFIQSALNRIGVPSLVGFLALGFLLRLADGAWTLLPSEGFTMLGLLARLGIIALLFRVGLESDVGKLRAQLGRAGPIWLGSVLVSGMSGYAAARWLLDFDVVPSLFAGVALTATSVGVSVSVWRERDALGGDTGALLLDTVELDDFSGVLLMAVLFNMAPLLRNGMGGDLFGPLATTLAVVLLKASVFAIGAFFAGLVFSRDPDSVRLDASFEDLYALVVPFFFIWLGFGLDPGVAAIVGKVAGTTLPALPSLGWAGGLAVGMSVVPRAEIMMVIMERGLQLGAWAVPPRLFGASVGVVLVTSAVFPLLVGRLLEARPELKA
ncbi:MAG: cation:proton antiporter [Gemmatimonadota bacterium]